MRKQSGVRRPGVCVQLQTGKETPGLGDEGFFLNGFPSCPGSSVAARGRQTIILATGSQLKTTFQSVLPHFTFYRRIYRGLREVKWLASGHSSGQHWGPDGQSADFPASGLRALPRLSTATLLRGPWSGSSPGGLRLPQCVGPRLLPALRLWVLSPPIERQNSQGRSRQPMSAAVGGPVPPRTLRAPLA